MNAASEGQQFNHVSVLLNESVAALEIKPDGVYVDCTFGRGGHSAAILAQLGDNGRLIAFDKDPEAIAVASEKFNGDPRFEIVHGSFATMETELNARELVGQVDGMLLDLGVSSPQLDDPQRGFSFLRDGPLDMRMNPQQGLSAASWLASVSQDDLSTVLYEYGDEKFRGRIARHIVEARREQPITTTTQLAAIIDKAVPRKEPGKHPATRSFQAIRIYINRELDDLSEALHQAVDCMAVGGRLAVISFHSLEDRMVKRFMRDASSTVAAGYGSIEALPAKLKSVGKQQRPLEQEVQENPRARSSVLRVAQRV